LLSKENFFRGYLNKKAASTSSLLFSPLSFIMSNIGRGKKKKGSSNQLSSEVKKM
jgi:hypothetical protein